MHSPAAIGVGIVGFGIAGRFFHAPIIQAVAGLRLVAVVQRSSDSARAAFPSVAVVRSVEELLAIDEVRLVVIATPNTTHAPLAARCLESGRHVVVDKPLAPSSAECEGMAAAAARAGRVLSVYQNRRWDGDFRTIARLLGEESCGRAVLLESRFDRYRPQPKPGSWRERAQPGSGVLYDLGPHLVDQALVLFGMPTAIAADVRIERDGVEVDDAFDVVLHYPRLRVRLGATMLAAAPGPRFVLRGTAGTFVKHGVDPQEAALRGGATPAGPAWGEDADDSWGVLTRSSGAAAGERVRTERGDYRGYYENVRDAINGTAPLAVTPQQATRVVRLIELAIQSSRTRTVVNVEC